MIREQLERMRATGRRLVASDEEKLYEYESSDHYHCYSCGVRFASASAEAAVQEEARQEHEKEHHSGNV